jgi:GNAT superfamily N-acetyltransferase
LIQSAQTYHLKDMVRLGKEYFNQSPYARTHQYEPESAMVWLRRNIIAPTSELAVAEWSDRTVGFASAYLCEYPWCSETRVNIEYMYVEPDFRGHGLFEGLIEHIVKWSQSIGAREVLAGDVGFNPRGIQAILTRQGFEDPGLLIRRIL